MKKIVVFSGAGLSKESGIPTFRDGGGLWHNHKVEDVAEYGSWYEKDNKDLMLEFYKERYENVSACEPNAAHYAIAKLQEKYEVINYTQNIDDLLERAGCENVFHLHGKLHWRKCEWHKNITNLDGDSRFICDHREIHNKPIKITDRCPKCGGNMRPDVVWFNEAVDMDYQKLDQLSNESYIFIGIGTSAQVSPAADLIILFKNSPLKFWIDPVPQMRLVSFGKLKGPGSEEMPRLAEFLLNLYV